MAKVKLVVFAILVASVQAGMPAQARTASDATTSPAIRKIDFVENLGQWAAPARFMARRSDGSVWVENEALLLQVPLERRSQAGVVLRLVFEGARGGSSLEGIEPRAGRFHFFMGKDPDGWHTGARSFGGVKWTAIGPGIDIVLRQESGEFEYDVLVAPCADLSEFGVRCDGADSIEIDEDGRLLTRVGDVILTQPMGACWQVTDDGTRIPREARFKKIDSKRFGFEVPGHDPELPLVIDPGLVYSTHLGSASLVTVGDTANKVALDAQDRPVVTGWAALDQFPLTVGVYSHPVPPWNDVFVTKLTADGSALVWSTLIGGSDSSDRSQAITIDDTGDVIVGGYTLSPDFPTTPTALDQLNEGYSGFVLKLGANGDQLVYSTFLGDYLTDVYGLDALPGGAVLAVGQTGGITTTSNVFQPAKHPGYEGFLCRISSLGNALEFSTYLGGTGPDYVAGVRASPDGAIVLTGQTFSPDLPTTPGAFQPVYIGVPNQGGNCFVAKVSADATNLLWLTYLGGSLGDGTGGAIAVPADGSVILGGATASPDFPLTSGAYASGPVTPDTPLGDAFVARVAADGTHLIYAALVASSIGNDTVFGLDADPSGTVTATGGGLVNFPTTPGAYDRTLDGGIDVSLFRLNPDGSRLLYSTFVGLQALDYGLGVAVHQDGRATVCGSTEGQFPVTPGCFDPTFNGGQKDGFVFKFDFQPTGVEMRGTSTPGCRGPITMGAAGLPMNPTTNFWLYASNAPPWSPGLLLVGATPPVNPIAVFGVPVWIDPAQRFARVGVQTDLFGYVETQFPIVAPAGTRFSAQYLFRDITGCASLSGLVASHALTITVQ